MRIVVSMETFSRGTPDTELDPWYVTGFVEGEGTFTYSRNGKQLAVYFGIKLSEADEPILEAIQAFFGGIGSIYYIQPRGEAAKGSAYYRVCRREQLPVIVKHFDAYPLHGSKLAAYRIWREMVMLKQRFRQPPREELKDLAAQLSASHNRGH
jgi:hypothetical protein